MTILVRTHDVDAAGLAALLRPRDDVVLEREEGDHRFRMVEGPFRSYERTVEIEERAGGRYGVAERIQYVLGVPYWGPLVWLPVRRAVAHHRPGDGRQPVWAPPQRLDHRAARVLATLAAVVVLSGFLSNTPAETLTYAADEFGFDANTQGVTGAVIRIGTLLALGLAIIADRRGRRLVLGVAMLVGVAGSTLGAIAPNIETLTVLLTITRTATASIGAIAVVMAVEEMPAGGRAHALSVLGMSAALGAGGVVWVQPVADVASWAWRIIYVVPLLALPFIAGILKRLPESRRFERRDVQPPLRPHWRGIVFLGAAFFLVAFFLSPIDWFRNEYLRDEHGFTATQVSVLILITATPGGLGLLIAGRLADTRGRRWILRVVAVVGLGAIVVFFNTAGIWLYVIGLVGSICSAGLLPVLGTFRSEFFPTSVRARAGAVTSIIATVGGALGILLAGWLRVRWGTFGSVIAVFWVLPLAALLVLSFRIRETSGRELEDIVSDDAPFGRGAQL